MTADDVKKALMILKIRMKEKELKIDSKRYH